MGTPRSLASSGPLRAGWGEAAVDIAAAHGAAEHELVVAPAVVTAATAGLQRAAKLASG